ncbi:MAG: YHS domain-containing protein [Nitrospirales bacterium]|nr:YHS domain-containing protein [Nitrospirales bacterium]
MRRAFPNGKEKNKIVKDPVCDMNVDPAASSWSATHANETYFFCSEHCKEQFQLNPGLYINKKREVLLNTKSKKQDTDFYICPMCPGVKADKPSPCPKCGMALEPEIAAVPATKTEYVCPMHPEVVQDQPGSCPKCGMALEPRTVSLEEEDNPELTDMTHRFWIGLVLTLPVFFLAMSEMIPGRPVEQVLSPLVMSWVQWVLATPVVLWCGWPFFQRAWASLVHRSLNMFTLIALGTGTAYVSVSFPVKRTGSI